MTEIDTNVSSYSLAELLTIIDLDNENVTKDQVIENTNFLINKFKNKKNHQLAVFFEEVQSELLQYVDGLEVQHHENNAGKIVVEPRVEGFGTMSNEAIYAPGEKQYTDWYENENLTQSNTNQVNKITQRKQKIQLFGNEHVPMKQEQIATTDTFGLPVKQDSLNPNLKNTINRFVNLDSQFRQYTSGVDSTSTDYTLDLSDTLKNALSLRLYSHQIPYSWYVIDSAYGNTCFWILDASSNNAISISVPPGNYTQTAFVTQLNASFQEAGFTFPPVGPPYNLPANSPVYFNANSGIITLFLNGGTFTDPEGVLPSFTISTSTSIVFYDFTGHLQCTITCASNLNHYFNNTLGWLMGYRFPYVSVDPSGNTASGILNLNGTKYLILVIDDYNQNHVNNSLVSITQYSNILKIPSYYSPDLPYTCLTPAQQGNNLAQLVSGVTIQSLSNTPYQQNAYSNNVAVTPQPLNNTNVDGLLIAGKYQQDYTPTQIVLPSAPRTLTKAQIYTINEINSNQNNLTNYLAKAPTSSDILAIVPVKTSTGVPTGSLLVDFSGSLQDSSRVYFGPVNIERMAVKLLDDKGNVLNLNGNDWCVTLVCECLYQY
jgi:nitrate reductase NapAB chaperone NapD